MRNIVGIPRKHEKHAFVISALGRQEYLGVHWSGCLAKSVRDPVSKIKVKATEEGTQHQSLTFIGTKLHMDPQIHT